MSTDFLMAEYLGCSMQAYYLMFKYLAYSMYVFAFAYHIPVTQHWHFYHSSTAEEGQHTFLGWRQQHVVETTRPQSYNKMLFYDMTSASGGAYPGKYPCDGWVDNLEPTFYKLNY